MLSIVTHGVSDDPGRSGARAFLFTAGCALAIPWLVAPALLSAGGRPWEACLAGTAAALSRSSLFVAPFVLSELPYTLLLLALVLLTARPSGCKGWNGPLLAGVVIAVALPLTRFWGLVAVLSVSLAAMAVVTQRSSGRSRTLLCFGLSGAAILGVTAWALRCKLVGGQAFASRPSGVFGVVGNAAEALRTHVANVVPLGPGVPLAAPGPILLVCIGAALWLLLAGSSIAALRSSRGRGDGALSFLIVAGWVYAVATVVGLAILRALHDMDYLRDRFMYPNLVLLWLAAGAVAAISERRSACRTVAIVVLVAASVNGVASMGHSPLTARTNYYLARDPFMARPSVQRILDGQTALSWRINVPFYVPGCRTCYSVASPSRMGISPTAREYADFMRRARVTRVVLGREAPAELPAALKLVDATPAVRQGDYSLWTIAPDTPPGPRKHDESG